MKLKEFAEHIGLSPTTVSRALGGYPEVNAETRARVIEEAARQGYRATRLLASADNHAALRLYRKLGYRELRQVRFFGGDYIAFEWLIGQ